MRSVSEPKEENQPVSEAGSLSQTLACPFFRLVQTMFFPSSSKRNGYVILWGPAPLLGSYLAPRNGSGCSCLGKGVVSGGDHGAAQVHHLRLESASRGEHLSVFFFFFKRDAKSHPLWGEYDLQWRKSILNPPLQNVLLRRGQAIIFQVRRLKEVLQGDQMQQPFSCQLASFCSVG